MTSSKQPTESPLGTFATSIDTVEGAVLSPRFYEGLDVVDGDLRQRRRYFTYELDAERVAGYAVSVTFTIHRLARDVWPHFKDFNSWQNSQDHFYSGVVGDLEGKTLRLNLTPNDDGPPQYKVLKVIPEHLIVLQQPGIWEGGAQPHDGYSVFMLNEHEGKTNVAIMMQHSIRTREKNDEEALRYWREMETELQRKWRKHFVPNLKKLVNEGR